MSIIPKIYVHEIRDALGRFPNWPLNQQISLGQVGFYNGRRATFAWRTTLSKLGINLPTQEEHELSADLYHTKNAVVLKFSVTVDKNSEASFSFGKSSAIATQSYSLSFKSLPLGDLESELLVAIKDEKIVWKKDWVIVTGIYHTKAFTLLISGAKKSVVNIATAVPINATGFNIADPSLGLGISYSKLMHYEAVATKAIEPFMQIHTLSFPRKKKPFLKSYGKKGWFTSG